MEKSVKELHDTTNTRIYDRNVPSKMLQPYFDVRPVATKYEVLPTTDRRTIGNVPVFQQPSYDARRVFNPSDKKAPWSGVNVNLESDLRNQFYALQKSSQAVYVPNSDSDLYQYKMQNFKQKYNMEHSLLFETPHFAEFSMDKGPNVFNNSTRSQINE